MGQPPHGNDQRQSRHKPPPRSTSHNPKLAYFRALINKNPRTRRPVYESSACLNSHRGLFLTGGRPVCLSLSLSPSSIAISIAAVCSLISS